MKRILSLLVAMVMLLGLCTFASANDTEITGRLVGLGILRGDDGGLRLEDNLTRAEFCALVARMLNLGDSFASVDTGFSDVPSDHWASGCIYALSSMGLVSGNGDGTFSPDNSIIYPEAVKVLVCAVGYEVAIDDENAYPNGYLAMGSKLGITSGTKDDGNAITRMTAASLIFNTLDVVPLEPVYGTDEYQTNDENLTLYELLLRGDDMIEFEGVLVENEYASILESDPECEKGYLAIDITNSGDDKLSGIIRIKTTDAYSSYLGYRVSGYVRKLSGKNSYELVSLAPFDGNNTETVVSAEDAELSASSVEYLQDESDKSKELKFDENVIYMYNNRLPEELSDADKIIYSGRYRFLDNDDDNGIDIVFIEEYESFIVERVNEEQLTVYFANKKLYRGVNNITYEIDDDEKLYEFTDSEGNEIEFTDIEPGNGITVMMSKDEVYTKIMVSDKSVSGKIEGVDSSENTVIINGESYELCLNSKGEPNTNLDLSDEATFVLDVFGKIIDIYGDKITKMNYAYVVAAKNGTGLDDGLILKLVAGAAPQRKEKVKNGDVELSYLFQNKEMLELKCAEKAVCYETSEGVNSNYHYVQTFTQVPFDGDLLVGSIIGYTTNSKNEINKIYNYPVPAIDHMLGNSEFNADILSFGGETAGAVIGRGYLTSGATQFICVPNHTSPSDEDYFVQLEIADESSGNYVYGVKSFFVNTASDLDYDDEREIQNGQSVDVLLIRAEMQSDNPLPVAQDADVCIIGQISQTFGKTGDDEGNEVYRIELLNGSETLVEYTPSSGKAYDTAKNLIKGDLIQYTKDGYGRVARIEVVGHVQGLDADIRPDDDRDHDYRQEKNMVYGLAKSVERDLYYHNYNEMIDLITLDFCNGQTKKLRVPTSDGPSVYLYEPKTGWIYPATVDDILIGESSICAYTDSDDMVTTVVIIND